MQPRTVFLDDGGVMNDNAVRGPQWQRLVGEYLAPRFGGEPRRWGEANAQIAEALWTEYADRMAAHPDLGYAAFWDEYLTRWFAEMCELVGVAAPGDHECRDIAMEASAYVTPRVRAVYPGAVEAIRELAELGYSLRTASGEPSDHLEGYLAGMGVRGCFAGPLYGPDIIDTPKHHALYYARMFGHAGVAPADSIVVDNEPQPLARAAAAGAATVLVSADGATADGHRRVASLSELPGLLSSIAAPGAV
jgi:beta-phosphoglucomutase-like phosphatase (HAD superfamily)